MTQATATSPIAQAAAVATGGSPAPARYRKTWVLADVFKECPGLDGLPVKSVEGFTPGKGVPNVIPGFIQEQAFLEEFLFFMQSPNRFMILLNGPTGCGKTERVLNLYGRLNYPVYHQVAFKFMRMHHLVGSFVTDPCGMKFVYGPLAKAMKNGYPYILDESMRIGCDITSKFHMIRDHGTLIIDETGEEIVAKPGFKFIMTANQAGYGDQTGMYGGDAEQDLAFLNGLDRIECGYPSPEIEEKIVRDVLVAKHPSFGTEASLQEFPNWMVSVANKVRNLAIGNEDNQSTQERVEVVISTRTLVKWAEAFAHFGRIQGTVHPLYRALDFTCLRGACSATRTTVDALIQAKFGITRSI